VAFGVFFVLVLLIFTEFNTGGGGQGSTILYKRGSKAQVLEQASATPGDDEEKAQSATGPSSTTGTEDSKEKNHVMHEQPKMTNTFLWRHLNYAVSVSGDRRLLLDDISGFVAPGKLTASMGESGAGKVWHFIVFASRF
jgi:ATP-binding cassette, subfamily G (WHITE), member 2, SNQ2